MLKQVGKTWAKQEAEYTKPTKDPVEVDSSGNMTRASVWAAEFFFFFFINVFKPWVEISQDVKLENLLEVMQLACHMFIHPAFLIRLNVTCIFILILSSKVEKVLGICKEML